MPKFQGSGFDLELPSKCIDASAYTFVLPGGEGFSPNLVIRFENIEDTVDLKQYADDQLKSLSARVDDFKLVSQASGKRGQWDGVMAVYEWGEGAMRMHQKQVYLLVKGKPARIYILTSSDLLSNSAQSGPVFDKILRSFNPNEIQVIG